MLHPFLFSVPGGSTNISSFAFFQERLSVDGEELFILRLMKLVSGLDLRPQVSSRRGGHVKPTRCESRSRANGQVAHEVLLSFRETSPRFITHSDLYKCVHR